MKTYDVLVERHNGGYRAIVPTLPNLIAEGATPDEAVINVKQTIEEFFKSVEVRTVTVDLSSGKFALAEKWLQEARRSHQNAEGVPGLDKRSPRIWLETAGMFAGDEEAMWQHIEEIEAERRRQREEVEREYDLLEAKGKGE
ncbi:MAG: type II toxin-antitoxin system HicB family antitoxin [Acidobacteriota bacterium]|nr:type II toxin-antitoxin system HicB family antitoxin [Acidobacteriota bacterium]